MVENDIIKKEMIKIDIEYKKIIENYTNFNKNLNNISEDIRNLENIHQFYINSVDISTINYSVYIDDIKHQINITKLEHDYIKNIFIINIEKMYRDLFKLYNRVTKILLNIYRENKDSLIKIWKSNERIVYDSTDFRKLKKIIKSMSDNSRSNNPSNNDNKIYDEIKKQYYYDLIIYNEMDKNHVYKIEDIIKIYSYLIKRIDELYLSTELIKINLVDIQTKTEKGILGQTFVMDLNGKTERIKVDYNIVVKLLESTLSIHLSLAEKYTDKSKVIADQVSCCEDSNISTEYKNIKKNNNDKDDNDDKDDSDIFLDKNF
jgi:hypothetical protein